MPSLNLELNYFDHPKAMRLESKLGNGADVLPIRLWAYVGRHKPETGCLEMLEAEIERVCRWWGDKGAMVAAMIELRILERDGDFYKVHDWLDHSGHLSAFKKRAVKANKIRWLSHRKTRTPTRTPKHDVKESSSSTLHSSAVHSNTLTPTSAVSAAALPYQRPDKTKEPVAALVMAYKEGLGVAFDDRDWDKQFWGRCSRDAKVIIEKIGGFDDALGFLHHHAGKFTEKGLSWNLRTIADRAVLWASKERKKHGPTHSEGISGADAQHGTNQRSGGLRKAVSVGQVLASVRGQRETEDPDQENHE